jgi:hypothetical protein
MARQEKWPAWKIWPATKNLARRKKYGSWKQMPTVKPQVMFHDA